jgi:hypothetical protein
MGTDTMSITQAALRSAVVAANTAGMQLAVTLNGTGTVYHVNPSFPGATPSAVAADPYLLTNPANVVYASADAASGVLITGTARMTADGQGVILLNSAAPGRLDVMAGFSPAFGPVAQTHNSPPGEVINAVASVGQIASVATSVAAVDATVGTIVGPGGTRIPDPNWVLGNGLS